MDGTSKSGDCTGVCPLSPAMKTRPFNDYGTSRINYMDSKKEQGIKKSLRDNGVSSYKIMEPLMGLEPTTA